MKTTVANWIQKRSSRFWPVVVTVLITAGFTSLVLLLTFREWEHWGVLYKEPFDGILGTIAAALIGAIVALVLVCVAIWQLTGIAGTASADFVLRKSDQFFKEDTRLLLHLIESDYLIFRKASNLNESYFAVNKGSINDSQLHQELKQRLSRRSAFSTYEIDDLLLGPLEDVGYLESVGIIDIDIIDNTFGFYIETIVENPAIKEYLKADISASGEHSWENVLRLYDRL